MISREQSAPLIEQSPEIALRADGGRRYERGGIVYATDGRVGTLRQVVVDEHVGEVSALVVEVDKPRMMVLLPPQAVAKTGGAAVYLSGSRQQFAAWLKLAPRVHARQVGKANLKLLLRDRQGVALDPMRSVARAGRDFVETGDLARQQETSAAARSSGLRGRSRGKTADDDRRPFSVVGAGRQ